MVKSRDILQDEIGAEIIMKIDEDYESGVAVFQEALEMIAFILKAKGNPQ